jgi:glyoxylate reductase
LQVVRALIVSSVRPKVLLTRRIPSSALATLDAACDLDRNEGGQLSPDQLKARLSDKEGVVCLVTDAITADVMDAAPGLKVIANVAVGYNNIDVPAAQARGIVVTNTPDVLTDATADLTLALIMNITRRHQRGRPADSPWRLEGVVTRLHGRQGIERQNARHHRIRPHRSGRGSSSGSVRDAGHPLQGARLFQAVAPFPLIDCWPPQTIVSIHCPLTPDTRHMINQAALARMKRSAYLINTSRGPDC